MFDGAYEFNGDITKWNTTKVKRMQGMFQNAKVFNQNIVSIVPIDIGGGYGDYIPWDTASVFDFLYTFQHAVSFDQNIKQWRVRGADTYSMFTGATALIEKYKDDPDFDPITTDNVITPRPQFFDYLNPVLND